MDKKSLQECVKDEIRNSRGQYPNGVLGVVSSYDRYTNTATVIASRPDSDEVDEVMNKVPCPVLLGIQSSAPEPGRPCFVVFKGGNRTQPLITHFYNHQYDKFDYQRQTTARVALPSYLLNL